jgi:hypothetical protein
MNKGFSCEVVVLIWMDFIKDKNATIFIFISVRVYIMLRELANYLHDI